MLKATQATTCCYIEATFYADRGGLYTGLIIHGKDDHEQQTVNYEARRRAKTMRATTRCPEII